MRRHLISLAAAVLIFGGAAHAEDAGKPAKLRIAVEPGQPGHDAWCELKSYGSKIEVWLDGVQQSYALVADEAKGYVRRYVTNKNGEVAEDDNGDLMQEDVFGAVSIVVTLDADKAKRPQGCEVAHSRV